MSLNVSATRPMIVFLLSVGCSIAAADNWPNWRGPNSNGVVAGSYPKQLTDATQLWKLPMNSPAGATPAVWGERIFVTDAAEGMNVVQCLDLDGKLLWEAQVGKADAGKHRKAGSSNSSPVCDGEFVFTYFKSGDLACFQLEDGKQVWHHNLQEKFGEDTLWWDLGTSPVRTKEHLVVACVQSGPSYLAAFDPATGALAWKVDRMLDAPEEANQTYSTPVVVNQGDREIIVVLGADHVTAHRAKDGRELWRVGGLNPSQNAYFRSIASPVYSDGVILAPYARGKSLTAIDLDGKVLWSLTDIGADVPTPAAIDGKAYVCSDRGELSCLDIKTGNTIWETATRKNRQAFSSSPVIAGDQIYLTREDGAIFVVPRSGGNDQISNEAIGEFTVSTPVFVDGRVLLRTSENLYCFGTR